MLIFGLTGAACLVLVGRNRDITPKRRIPNRFEESMKFQAQESVPRAYIRIYANDVDANHQSTDYGSVNPKTSSHDHSLKQNQLDFVEQRLA
jgi:hypothetical protein